MAMNKAQEDAAYYAVITAPVRYDPKLSSTAKLLYGEITSLCKSKGYCWATNSRFAELYSVSESTISRLISQLEKRGHIRTETVAVEKGSERRIYTDVHYFERAEDAAPEGGTQKEQPPSGGYAKTAKGGAQKDQEGVRKNRKQNDYQGNDLSEKDPPYSPPKGDGVPGEAEPEDKPDPKPKRKRRVQRSIPIHAPERFEQFWQAYPVGGSRLKAVEAWDALAPDDALIDEMARALRRQMKTRAWKDGIGIPHACRWLSNQRWTDKLPDEHKPQGTPGGWAPDPEVPS